MQPIDGVSAGEAALLKKAGHSAPTAAAWHTYSLQARIVGDK